MTDQQMTDLAWFILGTGAVLAGVILFVTLAEETIYWLSRLRRDLSQNPPEDLKNQSTPLDGNPPGAQRPEGRQPARYWLE